jgi:hypothetical protein
MKLLRYSCVGLAIVLGYIAIVACGGAILPLSSIWDIEDFANPLESDLEKVKLEVQRIKTEGGKIAGIGDSLMAISLVELQNTLQLFNSNITVLDFAAKHKTACFGLGEVERIVSQGINVDLIIWSFGFNDSRQLSEEECKKCSEDAIIAAENAGISMILMSQLVHLQNDNTAVLVYSEILQQLYGDYSVGYINGHTESLERLKDLSQSGVDISTYFASVDGLHFTELGIGLFCDIVYEAFNAVQ